MDHEIALIGAAALVIMIAASVFSRRTGVAAPLLLVGLGIGASYLPGAPDIELDPELILAGVLPLLLYSSAVNLPVLDVRRNLSLITWLSMAMVIVSALIIGGAVHLAFPDISFALGVALGAVVAPTDAVAATAIGRRVGLPPRLMAVLEGESLINDASALVTLRTAVASIAVAGEFALGATIADFFWAVLAAVVIGLVAGLLTVLLRQRLDDPVLNTTISFAVPFVAFFPAEEVGASGVLAVVIAGLTTGTLGGRRFSARDRQTQATTWSTISFILESVVFLLMGYQLPGILGEARAETTGPQITGLVALVLGLLIALRFAGLAWPALSSRFGTSRRERGAQIEERFAGFEEHLDSLQPADEREEARLATARRRLARGRADLAFEEREPITARGYVVLAWAGMRGVVTVAAAQTIPAGTQQRSTVVLAAFLVALVTLILFGLTLPALIRAMRLSAPSADEIKSAAAALLEQVGCAAIDDVGPVSELLIDGEPVDSGLAERLQQTVLPRLLLGMRPREGRADEFEQAVIVQRRYLDAMRGALLSERRVGAYSSATYKKVEAILDSLEQRFGG